VEPFALLATYLRTNMSKKSIMKWLVLNTSMAPVGVLGKIVIQQVVNPVSEGLIIAMIAGTILIMYVGASEIVNEEFEDLKVHEKYLKFFSEKHFFGRVMLFWLLRRRRMLHCMSIHRLRSYMFLHQQLAMTCLFTISKLSSINECGIIDIC
jgi:membrane associated rhomboid family serine protease